MVRKIFLVLAGIVLTGVHPSAAVGQREALLIANSRYQGSALLRNPGNDADAMESALRELDFSVTTKKDLNLRGLEEALVAFRRKLSKGGLGLFFYSGHGVQVRGGNYLIPIGANLQEESQVRYQCYDVGQALDLMNESECNLKVVILDCCRDNPFQRSWSRTSAKRGLAGMSDVPQGTIIAFSTSPNQTASDGQGRNSPYTAQLVSVLRSRPPEGLELSDLFRRASRAVKLQTGQVPWINQEASLEEYYLWRNPVLPTPSQPQPGPTPEPENGKQVEVVFTVRDGTASGPELSGAQVSLRWLASENAAPAVLGRATSDQAGRAKITAELSGPQLAGGRFEVLLTSREVSKAWTLDNFPRSLEWDVWLPRSAPVSLLQRPSSQSPGQPKHEAAGATKLPARPFTIPERPAFKIPERPAFKIPERPAFTIPERPSRVPQRPSIQPPGQREITNSIGMKLVLIPPGEFTMGSPESEVGRDSDEGPQHRVRITRTFYLGKHLVTQGEYEQLTGTNPSKFSAIGEYKEDVSGQNTSRFPVENLSWEDAVEFCRRLSEKEGRTYRLPTEAEWEYACRGGTTTVFHFGDKLSSREANIAVGDSNGGAEKGPSLNRPTPVGSYPPNNFGLYDMHGNAWEWCADWYDASYYARSPQDDPTGPSTGTDRVLRGGTWAAHAEGLRSANRWHVEPHYRDSWLGFRVALVLAE